ncbi:hypothetical protein VF04_04215 [Nostoc linckia z7]|uniref:Uncharacterized protein n=2 Tax=Nostoc linckia TaxID=92942 RepID=A0A9Q6EN33_NOSLI|nr:hypothetical protein [Nostoc linckia]PHK42918.1 hypothetical protein VF12_00915 [Nostoc linckia z15]PHK48075.1 hypothetical protein VF13_01890 [Nostoc linckia z16]PHJ64995.1 hypothetical protein VF02_11700 [Nostoc linckia z1]PHJ70173.1 hypothetical protein VF05_11860 [Nostoc linckia z3]PHJ75074.1 hypothetical protein VF03_12020 [Nostoc linckia z2]
MSEIALIHIKKPSFNAGIAVEFYIPKLMINHFYDPLAHSPQENQQYLIELVKEMRSLLVEMQHGEEDYLRSSKDTRAMLLAVISEAEKCLKPSEEPSRKDEIVVDYGFNPEHLQRILGE